jgi:hypothetical protein
MSIEHLEHLLYWAEGLNKALEQTDQHDYTDSERSSLEFIHADAADLKNALEELFAEADARQQEEDEEEDES